MFGLWILLCFALCLYHITKYTKMKINEIYEINENEKVYIFYTNKK